MASSFQDEALQEAIFSLRKSLAGYVSAMARACRQIDPLLVNYGNLASAKFLQASLDKTWNNYQESTARYRSLVDENNLEILEVNTYVQKCMQWRKWRKIASLWRFELDAKRDGRFWRKSPEG